MLSMLAQPADADAAASRYFRRRFSLALSFSTSAHHAFDIGSTATAEAASCATSLGAQQEALQYADRQKDSLQPRAIDVVKMPTANAYIFTRRQAPSRFKTALYGATRARRREERQRSKPSLLRARGASARVISSITHFAPASLSFSSIADAGYFMRIRRHAGFSMDGHEDAMNRRRLPCDR